MRGFANGLLLTGGYGLIAALVGMIVSGIALQFGSDNVAPGAFIWAALLLFASILLLIAGFCIDHQLDDAEFRARRAQPTAKIPLAPMEKRPNYNEDVMWWFHNGPEGREMDRDFIAAFSARALVPPPSTRPRR